MCGVIGIAVHRVLVVKSLAVAGSLAYSSGPHM